MDSQLYGSISGKEYQYQPLARENSVCGLTLDEVQNQFVEFGKPMSSMSLDELLKNAWMVELNQCMGKDAEGMLLANQAALQYQESLSLAGALSKKTPDEVWMDIQQSKNNGEKKLRERQLTLGEMTLEDFLVKAGVVADAFVDKKDDGPLIAVDTDLASQFPQQGQWMQYPECQRNMVRVYMPSQSNPQALHNEAGEVMDMPYLENQVALPSPLVGTLSDMQILARKRGIPEDVCEKTAERRQKRMIKNRESAARSRARKEAYTNELENKVSHLKEENERLRKRKELEMMLPNAPLPEPKYQLRRTSSASF